MQEQPEAKRHKHAHAAAYQIHETLEMETSRHRRQTNATNLAICIETCDQAHTSERRLGNAWRA